jgi:hypothetical protein
MLKIYTYGRGIDVTDRHGACPLLGYADIGAVFRQAVFAKSAVLVIDLSPSLVPTKVS